MTAHQRDPYELVGRILGNILSVVAYTIGRMAARTAFYMTTALAALHAKHSV
ncbi:hypothetical protein GOC45_19555 [Sinorhizobium meliloti]|nr:hypothetical protein [Sinorhizobium meliloti]